MKETTITLHSGFQIGQVDPRIFGGFLEHMGRAVYEGVYDPDSAHEQPGLVKAQPVTDGRAAVKLSPLSVVAITFRLC